MGNKNKEEINKKLRANGENVWWSGAKLNGKPRKCGGNDVGIYGVKWSGVKRFYKRK